MCGKGGLYSDMHRAVNLLTGPLFLIMGSPYVVVSARGLVEKGRVDFAQRSDRLRLN